MIFDRARVLSWHLILAWLSLLVPQIAMSKEENATSVIIGSCNIVEQNITVGKGATVINQVDCVPPTIEDSFLLRYAWLDESTSSLLVAGHFDSSLRPLIGNVQNILKNAVFRQVEDIVHRFGNPIRPESDLLQKGTEYSLMGRKGEVTLNNSGQPIPISVLKKLRLYAGSERIILPDISALQTLVKTPHWPSNYDMTYSNEERRKLDFVHGKQEAENTALMCVLLYRPLSKADLEDYWNNMEELEKLVNSHQFRQEEVINHALSSDDFRLNSVQNRALEAMQYFGERNWPDDFLLAFGSAYTQVCGEGYDIGFYALPRQLFTLVAVIEAKASAIEIQSMTFDVDQDEHLRVAKIGDDVEKSAPGAIILKKGETVIVPLRVELRYDLDQYPVNVVAHNNAKESADLYKRIMASPSNVLKFKSRDPQQDVSKKLPPPRVVFEKLKTDFRQPQHRAITQSYVFGRSYSLKDITLKGKAIPVRPAPASALVFIGGTGAGSCPFLFVDDEVNEYVRIGRILVGAYKQELARTETIQLPRGTRSVYISEQEPEVTHLERVVAKNSGSQETLLMENVDIRPGWSQKIEIPEPLRDNAQLIIRGHYSPLRLYGGPASQRQSD